ncbi:MAG: hypothetical protein HC872_02520 [Gammaproteobacteria bacterium]|nr:hypothetical protein [Gammaproteobacteria bacterium]
MRIKGERFATLQPRLVVFEGKDITPAAGLSTQSAHQNGSLEGFKINPHAHSVEAPRHHGTSRSGADRLGSRRGLNCASCRRRPSTSSVAIWLKSPSSPSAWSIASACATEAFHVARAKDIKLDFDDPVRYVKAFGEKIPNARPSMLLDHLAGRRAEVDNINGAIPREGCKVGIATPVNSLVVALLKAKESGFR